MISFILIGRAGLVSLLISHPDVIHVTHAASGIGFDIVKNLYCLGKLSLEGNGHGLTINNKRIIRRIDRPDDVIAVDILQSDRIRIDKGLSVRDGILDRYVLQRLLIAVYIDAVRNDLVTAGIIEGNLSGSSVFFISVIIAAPINAVCRI